MTCVYPLDAWRAQRTNESGKRGIVFNIRDGFADMPLQVPCGKCIGCAADRSKMWGLRMWHEASQHERNCFLTLTYREPAPETLNKRHLQLFVKRLRKQCNVRYFACGEYGEKTRRPHYHLVIFGEDFLGGALAINDKLYTNPVVSAIWQHGFISIGKVDIASCMYVAGYCLKKLGDSDTFHTMSRRPGIGHNWLDRFSDDLVRTGVCVIDGQEYPVPPRYLLWKEKELNPLKIQRGEIFRTMTPQQKDDRRRLIRGKEANYKGRQAQRTESL